MEGLTGYVFRRLHQSFFGGADAYYIPFVTPTQEPRFTERQLKDLAPSVNRGIHCVPQLLTRRPEDFVWAVKTLLDMGYDEANKPSFVYTALHKENKFVIPTVIPKVKLMLIPRVGLILMPV